MKTKDPSAAAPSKERALAPTSQVKQPGKEFAILGINPKTLDQAMEMAKVIANSDLVPKDYRGKPGNVLIAWEMSTALGIPPMQGIQNIAVINGRASIWGELATAVVRAHPLTEYLEIPDLEEVKAAKKAWVRHKRKGEKKIHTYSFSVDDAKTAGLWGKQGPWTNYPYWMLQMRANGFCYKLSASDMLKGLAIIEEVRDYGSAIDTTAESAIPNPKPAPQPEAQPAAAEASPAAEAEQQPAESPERFRKVLLQVSRGFQSNKVVDGKETRVAVVDTSEGLFFSFHVEAIYDLAKRAKQDNRLLEALVEDLAEGPFIEEAKLK